MSSWAHARRPAATAGARSGARASGVRADALRGEQRVAAEQLCDGILGAHGRLTPTLLERLLVRDRAAFRRSLERILAWPFARVIVAHGEVSEADGRAALERGYSWVLEPR